MMNELELDFLAVGAFVFLFTGIVLYCCTFRIYTFRNPNDIFYKPNPIKRKRRVSKSVYDCYTIPMTNKPAPIILINLNEKAPSETTTTQSASTLQTFNDTHTTQNDKFHRTNNFPAVHLKKEMNTERVNGTFVSIQN